MELTKLFEIQKKLDDRIVKEKGLEGQDLLPMKILALQVELGECANEWRKFKFWSEDQKPRVFRRVYCDECKKKGYSRENPPYDEEKGKHGSFNHWYYCEKCAGFLVVDRNPLLEEYVDCLHFILSIGLEKGYDTKQLNLSAVEGFKQKDITTQFNRLMDKVGDFSSITNHNNYSYFFPLFIALGEMLGFEQEEIEQAYLDKNKVNHQRQEDGY